MGKILEPNWKKAQEALSAGNADADAKNAELESKMNDLEDDLAKLRKELENAETDKTELQQQLFQVVFYFWWQSDYFWRQNLKIDNVVDNKNSISHQNV